MLIKSDFGVLILNESVVIFSIKASPITLSPSKISTVNSYYISIPEMLISKTPPLFETYYLDNDKQFPLILINYGPADPIPSTYTSNTYFPRANFGI